MAKKGWAEDKILQEIARRSEVSPAEIPLLVDAVDAVCWYTERERQRHGET